MFTITNWSDINLDKLADLYVDASEKIIEQKDRIYDLLHEEAQFDPSMSIGEFLSFNTNKKAEGILLFDAEKMCEDIDEIRRTIAFMRIAHKRGLKNMEHSAIWRIGNIDDIMAGKASSMELMSDDIPTKDGNVRQWHVVVQCNTRNILYVTMYHGLYDDQQPKEINVDELAEIMSDPDKFNGDDFTKMGTIRKMEQAKAEKAEKRREAAASVLMGVIAVFKLIYDVAEAKNSKKETPETSDGKYLYGPCAF